MDKIQTALEQVRFSHSSLASYRHCEKQFYYSYVRGLESNSDKWKSVKDLGTAMHEGIAHLLITLAYEPNLTVDQQISEAWTVALTAHDKLVETERVNWAGERDDDYLAQMAHNREVIPQLMKLYIPMMELGTRYRPAMANELFPCPSCGGTGEVLQLVHFDDDPIQPCPDCEETNIPLVEFEFETKDITVDGRTRILQGIVDAVLYDKETGTYILYDWKIRGRLLPDTTVNQDMQLALYATVLNIMAREAGSNAYISTTRMYQMLKTPPKPATLTQKNLPSKSACASYFDFWWDSIPEPLRQKLNRMEWVEIMADKLRQREDWVMAVDMPILDSTMEEVSELVEGTLNRIERSALNHDWLPSWGAHSCEFCQFKLLCQTRRNGGDIEMTINEAYHVSDRKEDDDDE